MKVALGTLEVDDDARKAIRKELGGKGHATRGEVKDFLLAALSDDVLPNVGAGSDEGAAADADDAADETPYNPNEVTGGPPEADSLPEPGSSPTSTNTVASSAPATTTSGTTGVTGSGYGANTTSSAPATGNTGDGGNTV